MTLSELQQHSEWYRSTNKALNPTSRWKDGDQATSFHLPSNPVAASGVSHTNPSAQTFTEFNLRTWQPAGLVRLFGMCSPRPASLSCPSSPRCPAGRWFPGSHGARAVLPHHPRSRQGIFLRGNWLIVALLLFVCLSVGFSFCSFPDLSYSWGVSALGEGWYGAATCPSCATWGRIQEPGAEVQLCWPQPW